MQGARLDKRATLQHHAHVRAASDTTFDVARLILMYFWGLFVHGESLVARIGRTVSPSKIRSLHPKSLQSKAAQRFRASIIKPPLPLRHHRFAQKYILCSNYPSPYIVLR